MRGTLEPQTGFYRTFRIEPPPFLGYPFESLPRLADGEKGGVRAGGRGSVFFLEIDGGGGGGRCTCSKPGRFGSLFVLCFLALGGRCLQMLCLPGFGTHANTQNLPHFRACSASIQEHCFPKRLFIMANAKLPNRPSFALLAGWGYGRWEGVCRDERGELNSGRKRHINTNFLPWLTSKCPGLSKSLCLQSLRAFFQLLHPYSNFFKVIRIRHHITVTLQ